MRYKDPKDLLRIKDNVVSTKEGAFATQEVGSCCNQCDNFKEGKRIPDLTLFANVQNKLHCHIANGKTAACYISYVCDNDIYALTWANIKDEVWDEKKKLTKINVFNTYLESGLDRYAELVFFIEVTNKENKTYKQTVSIKADEHMYSTSSRFNWLTTTCRLKKELKKCTRSKV